MAAELVKREEQAVAQQPSTLLEIIWQASKSADVDVAKLSALLELKERIDAKQAEIEYNRAFAAATLEMPKVDRNGTIRLVKDGVDKGSIPFSTYEDVDAVVKPIEARHGFTRSFTTEPLPTAGIRMVLELAHIGGHSKKSVREMPPDPGPGRNAMQAIGSASAYAKRYLTKDIWNIVEKGKDDDANSTDLLTDEQYRTLTGMISECELDRAGLERFLKFAHVSKVQEIQGRDYDRLMVELRRKLALVRQGKTA